MGCRVSQAVESLGNHPRFDMLLTCSTDRTEPRHDAGRARSVAGVSFIRRGDVPLKPYAKWQERCRDMRF